ncbi:MAG: alpha/beta hydrolase [Beijerinckiaceae bacterium]|nr:alpha/beta hydrolase [Beijerinckiaceae bacterium]
MTVTTTIAATAATLEASAIRHETPSGDGQMVWREWGAGQPLVLLHGGSGSWRHWLRNIDVLAEHFRVIVPDMPGYGSSAAPPDPVRFTTLGQIMGLGLESLLGEGTSYTMAGFSLGSFIAPHVISHCKNPCQRLVLIHGHFVGRMEFSPSTMLKRWRNVEDVAERRKILRHNLGALMLAHPQSADDATIDLYREDVEGSRLRVTAFIDDLDTDILTGLDAKICSISGRLDPTGVPDVQTQVDRLAHLCPGAESHIVENAGHWVMYEAAETFNTLLLDWLVKTS